MCLSVCLSAIGSAPSGPVWTYDTILELGEPRDGFYDQTGSLPEPEPEVSRNRNRKSP